MPEVLTLLRWAVFAAVLVASLGALAAMAVQRRVLNPFGRPARFLRDATDPVMKPLERRILRRGGNPQNAPWWLLGLALLAGILLLTVADWVVRYARALSAAAGGGARSVTVLLVDWTFSLLILSLMVRVIGSWFGVGPYRRWMRPFYVLTDWLVGPLRRVLPPFGPFDVSPIAAWLILIITRPLVLGLL
jgi:YggT family protein